MWQKRLHLLRKKGLLNIPPGVCFGLWKPFFAHNWHDRHKKSGTCCGSACEEYDVGKRQISADQLRFLAAFIRCIFYPAGQSSGDSMWPSLLTLVFR